jgi:putative FmdB family regulatory protein
MPIYEFKCLSCGNIFELLQLKKETNETEMKCPVCKSEEIEKVLSTVSVITSSGVKSTHSMKSCSSGSCASFEIPGPEK